MRARIHDKPFNYRPYIGAIVTDKDDYGAMFAGDVAERISPAIHRGESKAAATLSMTAGEDTAAMVIPSYEIESAPKRHGAPPSSPPSFSTGIVTISRSTRAKSWRKHRVVEPLMHAFRGSTQPDRCIKAMSATGDPGLSSSSLVEVRP